MMDEAQEEDAGNPFAKELATAIESAREAGAILLRHFEAGSQSWEKSEGNPVTEADLEADQAIHHCLSDTFPDDALLSEETIDDPTRLENPRCWIVDPMDGTKEFIAGRAEFAVSIALVVETEPVVGVIFNPVENVLVWASRGFGCYRDGARARISNCAELGSARAIASRNEVSKGRLDSFRGWFADLTPIGSIAWKLALIASGDADINLSLKPKNEWDVAAGDLLVREAGGHYLDFDERPRPYNQPSPLRKTPMAASSRLLLTQLFERSRENESE